MIKEWYIFVRIVLAETAISKAVYEELRNRIITPPTAQLHYYTLFITDDPE